MEIKDHELDITKYTAVSLGILILLIFISTVSAEIDTNNVDDIFTFNETTRYAKPCFNNNTYCDPSNTNCNFTIFYPNNSALAANVVATNNTYEYNISITPDKLGIYKADMICSDNGELGANTFYFLVSRTGGILTTGESIIYIIFLTVLLFTFLIALFGAIKIPFRNLRDENQNIVRINDMKYVKVFLIAISYVLLMFIFAIMRAVVENQLFKTELHKVFAWLFWLMFSFLIPMMILSFLFLILVWINDKKINQALKRGVPFR